MRIEVSLYATLKKYGAPDGAPLQLEIAEGTELADIVRALGIPEDEPVVMLVNGRPGAPDTVLQEKDRVVLFPPVAGG